MQNRTLLWVIFCGLLFVNAAVTLPAAAQTFVPTGSMANPRIYHTATLLNN